MHPRLTPVRHLEDLDRLLEGYSVRPVLLFKHSHTCGVSAEALDELLDHLSDRVQDASYAIVTVQTHRDLSNAVAKRLGVRHETPQVLLISGGEVVWSASHFRVTAAAVQNAITAERAAQ